MSVAARTFDYRNLSTETRLRYRLMRNSAGSSMLENDPLVVAWPDLSKGIISEMLDHPADWMEWPISGDRLATRPGDGLIHLVDWDTMEDE